MVVSFPRLAASVVDGAREGSIMPPPLILGDRGPAAEHLTTMTRQRVVRHLLACAVLLGILAMAPAAWPEPPDGRDAIGQLQALAWQRGPTEARFGRTAILNIREGE